MGGAAKAQRDGGRAMNERNRNFMIPSAVPQRRVNCSRIEVFPEHRGRKCDGAPMPANASNDHP